MFSKFIYYLLPATTFFSVQHGKLFEKPFTAAATARAAIYISCVDTAAARFEIA
jgi:hypothetical protein